MSVEASQLPSAPQSSVTNDCDIWRDYWRKRGQPWRTEPEIEAKRQAELDQYSATTPDSEQGRYMFRDLKLNRADIEWLLAMQGDGQGPVAWNGKQQGMHEGLDLRGANLRKARLQGLPLMGMYGGLAEEEWLLATDEQRGMAAICLVGADLREVHLEGAQLCGAHLEEADLRGAHLEGADLRGAYLAGASLYGAHLEGANLCEAHLEGKKDFPKAANLRMAFFDSMTNLEGITLGNEKYGFAPVADVHWGSVNLAVVDWAQVNKLGDEYETQWKMPVEYQAAIRANRQLASALRAQGLYDDASHFTYRAQLNQQFMRPQQALMPVVLRVFVRERMPLPKVLLRLEEKRQGQRMPRHLLTLALMRLIPLLLVLMLLALLQPWVLLALLVAAIVAVMAILPVMRKRGRHPPPYRRTQKQLLPPGLLPQRQRRKQQWLLLLGFLVGVPKSQLPLLLGSPSVALAQLPALRRLWKGWQRYIMPATILLLLLDDALLCYGRYVFSLFLNALTGYGYRLGRSLAWYFVIVCGFAVLYAILGHLQPPEAFVFSLTSFHGRGFFPGSSGSSGMLAVIEAVLGLIIEVSVIATAMQRFIGK